LSGEIYKTILHKYGIIRNTNIYGRTRCSNTVQNLNNWKLKYTNFKNFVYCSTKDAVIKNIFQQSKIVY